MAATVILWRPDTGEKRTLYTVDAKELLGGTNAQGWRVWSAQAEARELEKRREALLAAAKSPLEELAAMTGESLRKPQTELAPEPPPAPVAAGLLDEMLPPSEPGAGFPENPDPLES